MTEVMLSVTDRGFEPREIEARKDEPLTLVVTRRTERTCARHIVIDEVGVAEPLPLGTPVRITFTPRASGRMVYGCAMGKMVSGVLTVA